MGRFVPGGAGDARTVDVVFVMVLFREPDRERRISRLIWHRQSAIPQSSAR